MSVIYVVVGHGAVRTKISTTPEKIHYASCEHPVKITAFVTI